MSTQWCRNHAQKKTSKICWVHCMNILRVVRVELLVIQNTPDSFVMGNVSKYVVEFYST
jgi:hypothetical protein